MRGFRFLEHPCRRPGSAAFDICRHYLFHFGRRTSWIRFEPSLRETLVDSNHRCRASIRTLNGPFWARCKLGFDPKPRFITSVTNLGFVGCCNLNRGLYRPRTLTQSPEQGGGCRCLPNLPDSSWFSRYQLMSAPGCHLLQESLRLVLPDSMAGFLFLLVLAVRQPPLVSSLRTRTGVAVHTLLHSPRVGGATPPASAPPPLPLSSLHSSHRVRRAAAHTVVCPCPVRTAPGYTARSPPAACAAFCLRPC